MRYINITHAYRALEQFNAALVGGGWTTHHLRSELSENSKTLDATVALFESESSLVQPDNAVNNTAHIQVRVRLYLDERNIARDTAGVVILGLSWFNDKAQLTQAADLLPLVAPGCMDTALNPFELGDLVVRAVDHYAVTSTDTSTTQEK